MHVVCSNVNYFNHSRQLDNGQIGQVPGATVTFDRPTDGADNNIESFTLTFTNVNEALPYFPGRTYTVTIDERAVED